MKTPYPKPLTEYGLADLPLYPRQALDKAYEQGKREAVKELNDKEIQEVYSKQHEIPPNILAFAKAILRKAQEK